MEPSNSIYPLDDTTIRMIAELRQQQQHAQVAINAILAHFAQSHDLPGEWKLAQNERELIRSQPSNELDPAAAALADTQASAPETAGTWRRSPTLHKLGS